MINMVKVKSTNELKARAKFEKLLDGFRNWCTNKENSTSAKPEIYYSEFLDKLMEVYGEEYQDGYDDAINKILDAVKGDK